MWCFSDAMLELNIKDIEVEEGENCILSKSKIFLEYKPILELENTALYL